ncbi:hypothetical protein Taro_040691 [Colocasia esculenta]|uniref:Epidermal patterning factor-like protein n=1 Tax=Colocasia esculenta TaxID=4460 RepID=A0A843WCH3_COLES|nr:hypothetical protein [Colocasia esculenta]
MGSCRSCISPRSSALPLLLISLPLLLQLCSSAQARPVAQGRPLFEQLQGAKKVADEKLMTRALIGSRPPRCQRRCAACGHCEAVQVPAVPQAVGKAWWRPSMGTNSRGDDSSNYKPVSWKCKCGDIIMNP